jgi:hypothetical protein
MIRSILTCVVVAAFAAFAAADDHHDGPKTNLGKQELAGYTVAVTQVGVIKAGGDLTYEIVVTGGTGKPQAVRAWYGVESAEGSVKTKAVEKEKFWDADLELPAKLPEGAKCWIEIETADGKKRAAFTAPAPAAPAPAK